MQSYGSRYALAVLLLSAAGAQAQDYATRVTFAVMVPLFLVRQIGQPAAHDLLQRIR